jgi:hypothetical protein
MPARCHPHAPRTRSVPACIAAEQISVNVRYFQK